MEVALSRIPELRHILPIGSLPQEEMPKPRLSVAHNCLTLAAEGCAAPPPWKGELAWRRGRRNVKGSSRQQYAGAKAVQTKGVSKGNKSVNID